MALTATKQNIEEALGLTPDLIEPVFFAYRIVNLTNGTSYIGITKNPTGRWASHKFCARHLDHKAGPVHFAMKELGLDNFIFVVIACTKTQQAAFDLEASLVCQYDTFNNGYNKTLGGRGNSGLKVGMGAKAKMREAKLGTTHTPETRVRMSAAHTGKLKSVAHRESLTAAWVLRKMKGKGQIPGRRIQIVTPDGVFTHAATAALHYGIDEETARDRAKHGRFGWSFGARGPL